MGCNSIIIDSWLLSVQACRRSAHDLNILRCAKAICMHLVRSLVFCPILEPAGGLRDPDRP